MMNLLVLNTLHCTVIIVRHLFCTSFASLLCPLSWVRFLFQLAQDTVSDPGVCVADIKAKLYLYSVLRH